jgi:hypothetical protein
VAEHWKSVVVVASRLPQVPGHDAMLPPPPMHPTQQMQPWSAAHAVTSVQQLIFEQVSQAVSPGAGAQAPPPELDELDEVVPAVPHAVAQDWASQAPSAWVVASVPLQVVLQPVRSPGCCARQTAQQMQPWSAAHAVTSSQQLCLAQVTHASSPGAGAHVPPPELDVLGAPEVLDATEALEELDVIVAPPVPLVEPTVVPVPVVLVEPTEPTVPEPPGPEPLAVKLMLPPPPQPAARAAPAASEPTRIPSAFLCMPSPWAGAVTARAGCQKTRFSLRCPWSRRCGRRSSRLIGPRRGR